MKTQHAPLCIQGEAVGYVDNIKFLGVHIFSDLSWSLNTSHLVKKAQQRLFFLRKLKWAGLSSQLLVNFCRATIESILCLSVTVWYSSCTAQNRKDSARVVRTAQGIVGRRLPDLDSVSTSRVQRRAGRIAKDPTHLVPLASAKRYRNIKSCESYPLPVVTHVPLQNTHSSPLPPSATNILPDSHPPAHNLTSTFKLGLALYSDPHTGIHSYLLHSHFITFDFILFYCVQFFTLMCAFKP